MTPHVAVFLLGLFGVPLALLAYGHRLRRRSPRGRSAFWGAVLGHCLALVLAVVLGMIPPESWTEEERFRGFVGFWSLLILPMGGAIAGTLAHRAPARATEPRVDVRPVAPSARSSRRAST
ncbi:MAG TPA: hypothetical protein VLE53_04945 [Gemmatimonadaceae bacterium]|nr:hypothetical protein [Gemmatimonadaceae bacterium]